MNNSPYRVIAYVAPQDGAKVADIAAALSEFTKLSTDELTQALTGEGAVIGEASEKQQAIAIGARAVAFGAQVRVVDAHGKVAHETSVPPVVLNDAMSGPPGATVMGGFKAPSVPDLSDIDADSLVMLDGTIDPTTSPMRSSFEPEQQQSPPPSTTTDDPALRATVGVTSAGDTSANPSTMAATNHGTTSATQPPSGTTQISPGFDFADEPLELDDAPMHTPIEEVSVETPLPAPPPAPPPPPSAPPNEAATHQTSPPLQRVGSTTGAQLRRRNARRTEALLTASNSFLFLNGRLRKHARLRVIIGFSIALLFGAVWPMVHATSVMNGPVRELRVQLSTAKTHGTWVLKGVHRDIESLQAEIDTTIQRQATFGYFVWLFSTAALLALWFRFT